MRRLGVFFPLLLACKDTFTEASANLGVVEKLLIFTLYSQQITVKHKRHPKRDLTIGVVLLQQTSTWGNKCYVLLSVFTVVAVCRFADCLAVPNQSSPQTPLDPVHTLGQGVNNSL